MDVDCSRMRREKWWIASTTAGTMLTETNVTSQSSRTMIKKMLTRVTTEEKMFVKPRL